MLLSPGLMTGMIVWIDCNSMWSLAKMIWSGISPGMLRREMAPFDLVVLVRFTLGLIRLWELIFQHERDFGTRVWSVLRR